MCVIYEMSQRLQLNAVKYLGFFTICSQNWESDIPTELKENWPTGFLIMF